LVSGETYRAVIKGQRGFMPALVRVGLRALSVPYAWAAWTRNRLYDRGWVRTFQAPVPVISVGNLTLGGTGKTPCVEYIARYFRAQGRRVAILSRGYGSHAGPNDEARALEANLPDVPHLQDADRVALAVRAVQELGSEVLILDDGFQHRRLARDLDLVLVDATNPWGYGYLFPRGLLRERPVELRRASAVILTRCNQVEAKERGRLRETVTRFAPQIPVLETSHRPLELVNADRATADWKRLSGQLVAGFCGVGNPEAFRKTLTELGANVIAWRTFPDHHRYSRQDVDDLRRWSRSQPADCLLATTQKDLVKIRLTHLDDKELWAVRVCFHFDAQENAFHRLLDEVSTAGRPAVAA
jgi:tetraacyldisaccharide 4'-kinase